MRIEDYSSYLQQVSEITSQVFGLETTVVDHDYVRIAGTHRFQSTIGQYVPNAHVFRYVIEKKLPVIIRHPREEIACLDCQHKLHCHKEAAIYVPIIIQDIVVGGMAVVAYNEDQKRIISDNTTFFNFFNIFSQLLAGKIESEVSAKTARNLLHQSLAVLDTVRDGVIATDHQGYIKQVNKSAKMNFKFTDSDIGKGIQNFLSSRSLVDDIYRKRILLIDKETHFTIHNTSRRIYLTCKPIDPESATSDYVLIFKDKTDADRLAKTINFSHTNEISFDEIIGSSPALTSVIELAQTVAIGNSNVLIQGESGTGKEMFARAIHSASLKSNGPFIAVNCAAIPEPLLESELFGYSEGAFTGAKKGGKPGKCELASGGTLFLDEIGDIPLFMQSKLLRMIQEKTIERVGGTDTIELDIRIISATHKNLEEMVANQEFRQDLYYRLNVIPIHIPSLKERRSDIEEISSYMLNKCNNRVGKNINAISDDVTKLFYLYDWPGNIRELENTIEYAVNIESTDTIELESLPSRILQNTAIKALIPNSIPEEHHAEAEDIISVLNDYGWDTEGKQRAAKAMNIGIATLYRKIKKYNIKPSENEVN